MDNGQSTQDERTLITRIKDIWPDILHGPQGVQQYSKILQATLSNVEPAFVHETTLYLRAKNQFVKNHVASERSRSTLEKVLHVHLDEIYVVQFFVSPNEILQTLWSHIIVEVRSISRMLYSLLLAGVYPIDFSNNVLSIQVTKSWVYQRLNNSRFQDILRRTISNYVTDDFEIRLHLLDEANNLPTSVSEVRQDQLVRAAVNIFDATIVAIDAEIEEPVRVEIEQQMSPPLIEVPPLQAEVPSFQSTEDVDALNALTNFLKNKGQIGIGLMMAAVLQHVAVVQENPSDELVPLNNTTLAETQTYPHDKLLFRSPAEIKIYDALKQRNVLFFPNTTAVLGGKNAKREPDFLICQEGKWGVLEVMGDTYHPSNTAMKDHDRARLFKDYGLMYIEFYAASRCMKEPEDVVDDFLKRLSKA